MSDPFNLRRRGKKGFWVPDFVLYGTRYHTSTKCVAKPDAIRRCEEWVQAARDLRDGKVRPAPAPTLEAAFRDWERIQGPQVDPRTVVNMRCAVRIHAAAYLETPVDQLGNRAILEIRSAYLSTPGRGYRTGQDWESTRTHSEGGANSVIRRLSALVGWCVETGMIPVHPFKVKALKPQPSHQGIVWPEKVQAFYAEADRGGRQHVAKDPDKRSEQVRPLPHSAIAIRLMIALGLREDEALGARWSWVDWRRQVYIVGEAKDRALREVPMPDWLPGFLRPLKEAATTDLILPGDTPAKDGSPRPHHKNFTQKPVARIAEKLEIEGLTPNRLRATFATTHYEAGTPLSQITQMMGHEDPETTLKHYIVQRPKDQMEAQNRVAELQGFSKAPKNHPNSKIIPFKPKQNIS